jgi:hypothetical protein
MEASSDVRMDVHNSNVWKSRTAVYNEMNSFLCFIFQELSDRTRQVFMGFKRRGVFSAVYGQSMVNTLHEYNSLGRQQLRILERCIVVFSVRQT